MRGSLSQLVFHFEDLPLLGYLLIAFVAVVWYRNVYVRTCLLDMQMMDALQRELHSSQETVRALTLQNAQLRDMIVQRSQGEPIFILSVYSCQF